jgi:hypothetical protein
MPQFDFNHPVLVKGQIAESGPRLIDSYTNELLAQSNDIPIGGTTDGDYTVQIDGEEGTFTFTFAASGNTADQIADGLAAAVLADDDLANIVVAASTSGTPLELRFIHTGKVYTISFPSNPGSNMTNTLVQAAGGVDFQLGVGVVQGSADDLGAAPSASTVDADVLGFSVIGMETRVAEGLSTNVDVISPGGVISTMRMGTFAAEVEEAVAANAQAFMRIQNPGPGQFVGSLRSDVDGGNAIALTGVIFKTSTAGVGLAVVKVNRPA